MRVSSKLALAGLVLVSLGCGGGGGGGGSDSGGGTPLTTREASIAVPQAFLAANQTGGVTDFTRAQNTAHGLLKYAAYVGGPVGKTRAWEFDEDWGVYFNIVSETETQIVIHFREDPLVGDGAGTLVATLEDDEPYPVRIRMDFDIWGIETPVKGTLRVQWTDEFMEDGRVWGNFTSSNPATSLSLDLTIEALSIVDGTATARVDGVTLKLTDIFDGDDGIYANFEIGNFTGTVVEFYDAAEHAS